jgi:hypothetical protein
MPGSGGSRRSPDENALMLQPVEEAKTTAPPSQLASSVEATPENRATPPPLTAPPTEMEDPSEVAAQSPERLSASPPPAAEASALLAGRTRRHGRYYVGTALL